MLRLRTARMALAILSVWGLAASRTAAEFYTVTDLGTLPGMPNSLPYGVNNLGQVVGVSSTGNGDAFLYSGGRMHDLGGGTIAWGINDSGQVVGVTALGSGHEYAFLYSNGKMQDLGTLGGKFSDARAINAAGQIVGVSQTADSYHAFLYSGGRMHDIGRSSAASDAFAINASGQVAGWAWLSGSQQAAVYSGGTIKGLGNLGVARSAATGINGSGEVVGWADLPPDPGSTQHAFLYRDGRMQDLGTLLGGQSRYPSYAYGINDSGQVVGMATAAADPGFEYRAFLYDGKAMTDLNRLIPANSGWVLGEATAINNRGQIVGAGVNPSGEYHAFLLTPHAAAASAAPEPGSLTLAAIGILGLFAYARQRRRRAG